MTACLGSIRSSPVRHSMFVNFVVKSVIESPVLASKIWHHAKTGRSCVFLWATYLLSSRLDLFLAKKKPARESTQSLMAGGRDATNRPTRGEELHLPAASLTRHVQWPRGQKTRKCQECRQLNFIIRKFLSSHVLTRSQYRTDGLKENRKQTTDSLINSRRGIIFPK